MCTVWQRSAEIIQVILRHNQNQLNLNNANIGTTKDPSSVCSFNTCTRTWIHVCTPVHTDGRTLITSDSEPSPCLSVNRPSCHQNVWFEFCPDKFASGCDRSKCCQAQSCRANSSSSVHIRVHSSPVSRLFSPSDTKYLMIRQKLTLNIFQLFINQLANFD